VIFCDVIFCENADIWYRIRTKKRAERVEE